MVQGSVRGDLELRHLRVFVAVVEAGTHTGAARTLEVSQSTVSETIVVLERALGTALLRRSGRGAVLTESGEALLPYARRMLALANELVVEVAKVSSEVKATLAVAAVESLCTYVLPPRLAPLHRRWPKLRVEVITGACTVIREHIAAAKIDVGLLLEVADRADDAPVLTTGRLVVFGAASHPLARKVATADQLRRCDFYMSDVAGDYHEALRRHFEAAETPTARTVPLGTIEAVKRGVMASTTALGLLPEHAVAQELRDGLLAEVTLSSPMAGLVLRAIVAPGPSSPMVDALIESLRGMPLVGEPQTATISSFKS